MKKESASEAAFFSSRGLIGLFVCLAGALTVLFASGALSGPFERSAAVRLSKPQPHNAGMVGLPLAQFEKTGSLNTARTDHTATLLPNGKARRWGRGHQF
jgi:hypothetical protein